MTDSELPLLIQQMLEPDFYPHPVQEPIELLQTHISFILLTGEYAYKIKKIVDFGFLDYSTLEKRRYFCEQELQMNQQQAPELYLEVLPIIEIGDRFQFGENQNYAIEYSLKMRQFPQENLFINLFNQDKLTKQEMETLGNVVAKFHLNCPSNEHILKFGEIAQIRHAIDGNYLKTEKYIGCCQTQEQYEQTKQYTDSFFETHEAIFKSRIKNRFIRECHGDLHLKNICIYQDKILLFDRIEFNQEFRFVDVIYDVAFVVMDLEGRGRNDLGNKFLNTYIENTGDWEGLQLLPFYLTRQAYVRAKINSLILDDSAITEKQKEIAKQEASQYYKLAWQYTRKSSGGIVMMSGLSGSGKSTTARQLSKQLNAIHIRSDAVRKHLANVPLHEPGGEEIYTPEMTEKIYKRLLELGLLLAKQGFWVILDAKYEQQERRGEVIETCHTHQLPLQIIECTAPMDILQERLQQRQGDISDATIDLLTSQRTTSQPFTDSEKNYLTTIDTTQNIDQQWKKLY
ncbi:MAG: AAA family ATPase [Planktothrix agardhii KL2]|uniref:bifunctional aminoglycoside phosphotransferase/ATP-binding protein n=1 Tax=Planktothrix agardhii TaxID=1160 RepID=UPI001A2A2D3E|nr:bifunctional aminoglycoside phosphotransferase/ATP-binding protein [Planktothrix agardhii]MBG0745048.1 AAA family ATPase [Planktothrix agardhii KL2]